MPHQIDKTALVMHSAERMFHLVNDVASYPDFLPWCSASQVHEQTDTKSWHPWISPKVVSVTG